MLKQVRCECDPMFLEVNMVPNTKPLCFSGNQLAEESHLGSPDAYIVGPQPFSNPVDVGEKTIIYGRNS